MKKLLMSAVANAKGMGKEVEDLIIKELRVDKGVTLKRMMPAAMGTGHRINKRTSHILLTLGEKVVKAEKKLKAKAKKVVKKVAIKKATAKAGQVK
jgi:large subunit ribosomal protein L22